jgi:hypothetical protein
MDVDEVRQAAIAVSGLVGLDEVYTFYNDETNNTQKLRINENGLNVADPKVFVLGGILHAGSPRPIDLAPLRQAMRIQKTAIEIKLEHVAKGEFLACLGSSKLTAFLRWLEASELLVHYTEIDPLYWSCVDIIDSILAARSNLARLMPYANHLKSDLVSLLRVDLPATVSLFQRFGYPGLQPSEREPFVRALLTLMERNATAIPAFNYTMVEGVVQAGREVASLVFIEDNPRGELITTFSHFYRGRVALFKYSNHVFDEEGTIQEAFETDPLTSEGRPLTNYRFADSKAESGIQVSDVIVGLLGKMHSYCIVTPADEVGRDRDALAGPSLENANLLRDLIDASDRGNQAFQQHVASLYDRDKVDRFLRFRGGRYASFD